MPVKKIVISLILILVLIGGFVAGLLLIREQQDIREEAAVPEGQATVILSPSNQSAEVGDTFQSRIYFNTSNIPVSSVVVKLSYPFSGLSPEVIASNLQVNPSFSTSTDWDCTEQEITEVGGEVSITVGCANFAGYATTSDTLLATFDLTVESQPTTNPVVIKFDSVESVIKHKSSGQDILTIPSSTGSYLIEGGETTSTPTPTSSLSPTVTTKVTATPTTTSVTTTPTITTTTSATPTTTPPVELLDSGFSGPTLIGIGLGLLTIFGSLAIAL